MPICKRLRVGLFALEKFLEGFQNLRPLRIDRVKMRRNEPRYLRYLVFALMIVRVRIRLRQ